ncbi:RbsD/FucU family protein [Heyndrickxia ginsengihumi]|uniref:Fucose isomerase n=1 Tax=Heyndrickxia ginsengihumi TaxID=363870 RepID=A0A0A6VCU2_9BACI|nr:RbsD/FucU domain-containing protein [Heyndrickxia ginsengihumi]KHD84339.1 fucose isomerase [Heyndrickxia ginsengihumi]MBE6183625.1 fucose isomerase [Bacillus sp. (in: firmicutes)]MCM3023066.1 fucose isomerase [Heyndrickxia ginsengihumi]NEY19536.1 fucose isomerase [Heyndrickxia ginsengihumi]
MLKHIPAILSPEILKVLMEMGHGDELVLADGNFPSASHANILARADGLSIPVLLEAILKFFPLDTYSNEAVTLMKVSPGDDDRPKIWKTYEEILEQSGAENKRIKLEERFSFYEHSKNSYAVIATGEESLYANIILKKGVVR